MVENVALKSASEVQSAAELPIIEALSARLGVALAPRRLELAVGIFVHVDAVYDGPPAILVEVFAHQGPLKPGQNRKLLADALKLLAVSKVRYGSRARVILALTDEVAARGLRTGWRQLALEELGVDVLVVPLPAEAIARILEAQRLQRMVNATVDVGTDE